MTSNESHIPGLFDRVKQPVSESAPCGTSVEYDDDFQKMKADIGRTGTGSIDYEGMAETAVKILSERSKDLRVASYLCIALWKTHRSAGLHDGVRAVNLLMQEYWDGLFPAAARLDARVKLLEFLSLRIVELLENYEATPDDEAGLNGTLEALGETDKLCQSRFPENPPSMLAVSRVIREALNRIPKASAPPEPKPSPTGQSAPETSSAPAAAETRELRSADDAREAIRKAVSFIREKDRTGAAPYRVIRALRWEGLTSEPPNENGKTKLEAPNAQRRKYFETLHRDGKWGQLIDEGEAAFAQGTFHLWLDLQWYLQAAMDAQQGFGNARAAIQEELAVLLRRVPALTACTYSDGTPFAGMGAKGWITETVMPAIAGGANAGQGQRVPLGSESDAGRYDEARAMLAKGDLAGAVAFLSRGNGDASGKARFLSQLSVAELCLKGSQPECARALLEYLDREIVKFQLDIWEPEIALQTWSMLYACSEHLAGSAPAAAKPAFQEAARQAFGNICRVDPQRALALAGVHPKTVPAAAAKDNGAPPASSTGSDKSKH